jgi:hypothetical protein
MGILASAVPVSPAADRVTLGTRQRKTLLAVHLACSVGWIGAATAYLVLGIASTVGQDPVTVRGTWVSMELIGWWALVLLALGTLVSGIALAAGTRWGLLRHYWVLISLVVTSVCTLVLILHMPDVSTLTERARTAREPELDTVGGDLFHAGLGTTLLVAVLVLNIYKPAGLTRYGWRRQQAQSVGSPKKATQQ